jgi:PhoH-like ATPase
MRKNYVLDTNVLLHDAGAIHAFEDNNVIIPIYVIEEIDTFKKELNELGRNARFVSRQIDKYRARGSIRDGIPIDGGGSVRVIFATSPIPPVFLSLNHKDDQILAVALEVATNEALNQGLPTIFITMDTNLRIRADAIGLDAQDYKRSQVKIDELYKGHQHVEASAGYIDALFRDGSAPVPEGVEAVPNLYLTFQDPINASHSGLGKVAGSGDRVVPVPRLEAPIWGIRPRNREQRFALDLLLDDDVKLVTLSGKAGTGKTLLAIAAGLYKVTDDKTHNKLLVSRPIFPLGRDIGFLPGTVDEKLNPWMQPIHDSVDFLMSTTKKERGSGKGFEELKDLGFLEIEPLTYIRGRSIPNQFMVVDEAQNLTHHEVKTILTRAGEGTKVVLTGDPYQIDQPYLDAMNNGLTYTVERMKGAGLVGSVTLTKGERSVLAELAADRL